MSETIIDFRTFSINLENLNGTENYDIDKVEEHKISNILSEDNILRINFRKKDNDYETVFLIENTVQYYSYNCDFNNLCEIKLSYTSSLAIDKSKKYEIPMFHLMIWDNTNMSIPKIGIIGERLKIIGDGSLGVIKGI